MLLGSRPYPLLILEENGHWAGDDDDDDGRCNPESAHSLNMYIFKFT